MGLQEEYILENWFETNDLEKSTQKQYRKVIYHYSQFLGKSLTEIYESALQEEKANIFLPERQYAKDITQYRAHLKREGFATQTINLYMSALISMFRAYSIREPNIRFKKGSIGLEKNFGKLLTKEEIIKMVESSKSRDKAIIYMMALTGMSQKEVRDFKLKKFVQIISNELKRPIRTVTDLFNAEDDLQHVVIPIEMLRKKVNYRYITFLPPEATHQIFVYLKERYHGRNMKIKFNDDFEGTLFVSTQGKTFTPVSFSRVFVEAGRRAGFDETHEKGSYRSWRSHGMRRYFISTIINKIHMHDEANFMAGHQISGQDLTYWRVNYKELKKVYLEALPFLSLENVEVQTIQDEDLKIIDELKDENKAIRKENKEIKEYFELLKRRNARSKS